jgi:MoxR-like ATPase
MSNQDTPARAPDWFIFCGEGPPEARLQRLLATTPPWRDMARRLDVLARTYRFRPNERELVNAALYLRRPLLITGPPGSGKSSLAYAVSLDLGLGEVLRWPINSRSTLGEGLYAYDAIARLREVEVNRGSGTQAPDIGRYIRLNALGTALYPSDKPRVVLIDEIDKGDIDLPNDLLHVLEEGQFEIPELARVADQKDREEVEVETADPVPEGQVSRRRVKVKRGLVRCTTFPFVVLTSNGERDLPPAFFRRCLRLDLPTQATPEHLAAVVRAHLPATDQGLLDEAIKAFLNHQENRNLVASDQLLNAIYLITRGGIPPGGERKALIELLMRELNR